MAVTGPGASSNSESAEACVRSLADSPAWRKAPAIRSLLLFLWQHRNEPLSEYRIATECLGRGSDFDPKIDATVRVHMSRLRAKLKDQDGAHRVTIPLGTYRVEFEEHAPIQEHAPSHLAESTTAPWRFPWLGVAAAALTVLCLALLWQNVRLSGRLQRAQELPRFWSAFFDNGRQVGVVLPTPVFFEWPDNPLKVRDTRINEFEDYRASPLLDPLIRRHGAPKLMQNYTVVSDTFAAVKLGQYLQAHDVKVAFSGASEFSFDRLGEGNTVLIGLSSTSFHIRQLMTRTNFYSDPAEASAVHNRAPRDGEAPVYKMVLHSGSRRRVPGVVAVLPGASPASRILMVASWSSSALISFLSSPSSLGQVDDAWRRAGSPAYFELLVQSEIEGNAVLHADPVSLRPFAPAALTRSQ